MLNLITLMTLKICWDTFLNFRDLFWGDGTRHNKVVSKTFCIHSAVKNVALDSTRSRQTVVCTKVLKSPEKPSKAKARIFNL